MVNADSDQRLFFEEAAKDAGLDLISVGWRGADLKIENIKLVDDAGKPSKTRYTRAVVYCDGTMTKTRIKTTLAIAKAVWSRVAR